MDNLGIRCRGGAVVIHTVRAWLSSLAAWLLLLALAFGAATAVFGEVPLLDRFLAPAGIVTLFAAVAGASTLALTRPIVPWLFVTLIVVTVAGFVVLITATVDEQRVARVDTVPTVEIEAASLVRGRDVALYTGAVNGIALSRPAVFRFDRVPRISRPPEAVIDSVNARIVVSGESDISLKRFQVLQRPEVPDVIARIGVDAMLTLQRLAGVLAAKDAGVPLPDEIEATLAIAVPVTTLRRAVRLVAWFGVLALAVAMAWTPARLTRWQLLNWLLALAYVRVLLALPRWTDGAVDADGLTAPLARLLTRLPQAWTVPLLWAACALLLLIVAAVLPSLNVWRREYGVEA